MSSSSPAPSHHPTKQYRLVAYIRVDPENPEPMTYEEALAEKEQQELMCPENLYQLEEVSAC